MKRTVEEIEADLDYWDTCTCDGDDGSCVFYDSKREETVAALEAELEEVKK